MPRRDAISGAGTWLRVAFSNFTQRPKRWLFSSISVHIAVASSIFCWRASSQARAWESRTRLCRAGCGLTVSDFRVLSSGRQRGAGGAWLTAHRRHRALPLFAGVWEVFVFDVVGCGSTGQQCPVEFRTSPRCQWKLLPKPQTCAM